MSRYIVRRLVQMIPLLFGISIITFAIVQLAPGDPAELLAPPEFVSNEAIEAARERYGLNDPVPIQYVKTMSSMLTGDLRSFKSREPVLSMIWDRLPTTALIGALALVFGVSMGIALGVMQALRPRTRIDDLGTFISILGFAVPNFWLALMLIMVFSVRLDWLPATGIRPIDATGWNPLEIWPHLILPTVVLGTGFMASVARFTRSSMLEALDQDYVRTARSKGMRERLVVVRHALRNSLLPVITLVGYYFPFILGGTVVVEMIFGLPGIGRLALDSVYIRDYPVILTINMMLACMVLLGNLLADIGYAVADPRIRYS